MLEQRSRQTEDGGTCRALVCGDGQQVLPLLDYLHLVVRL